MKNKEKDYIYIHVLYVKSIKYTIIVIKTKILFILVSLNDCLCFDV